MSAPPNEDMIARASRGEKRAQAQVAEFLYPLLHRQIGFSFGFPAGVDDAVQESLLEVLRALPSFRFRSSLSTWAVSIAHRVSGRVLAEGD